MELIILLVTLVVTTVVGTFTVIFYRRQARAAEEQVALTKMAEEDRRRKEAAEEEVRRSAKLVVWRETRQPPPGGAAIVAVNEGKAPAHDIAFEVTAAGHGSALVLDGEEAAAARAELLPGAVWAVNLHRSTGANAMPIRGVIRWRDGRGPYQDVHWEVIQIGTGPPP
jgi:hypothetical protein